MSSYKRPSGNKEHKREMYKSVTFFSPLRTKTILGKTSQQFSLKKIALVPHIYQQLVNKFVNNIWYE